METDILCWEAGCGQSLTLGDDARWRCPAGHEWSNDKVREHIAAVAEARRKTQGESVPWQGLMDPPVPIGHSRSRSSRSKRHGKKRIKSRRWWERENA